MRIRYLTEGKDSEENVAMSTTDDGEDKREAHARALLHGAPQPALRQPQPGEPHEQQSV